MEEQYTLSKVRQTLFQAASVTILHKVMIIHGHSMDAVIVVNNRAMHGGGIYATSHFTVSIAGNSVISYNHADYNGGGIYASSYTSIFLTGHCVISNNQGKYGGALYCDWNLIIFVSQSILLNNTADYRGGVYGYECTTVIHNNSFGLNIAVFDGGAINGGIELDIYNTGFTNNKVVYGRGGAVCTYGKSLRCFHCTFHNNTAAQCGALSGTKLEMSHSVLSYNTATGVDEQDGGGVLCVWDGYVVIEASSLQSTGQWRCDGDRSQQLSISLSDSTFIHNTAGRNGGVLECDYCNIITIGLCEFRI